MGNAVGLGSGLNEGLGEGFSVGGAVGLGTGLNEGLPEGFSTGFEEGSAVGEAEGAGVNGVGARDSVGRGLGADGRADGAGVLTTATLSRGATVE